MVIDVFSVESHVSVRKSGLYCPTLHDGLATGAFYSIRFIAVGTSLECACATADHSYALIFDVLEILPSRSFAITSLLHGFGLSNAPHSRSSLLDEVTTGEPFNSGKAH